MEESEQKHKLRRMPLKSKKNKNKFTHVIFIIYTSHHYSLNTTKGYYCNSGALHTSHTLKDANIWKSCRVSWLKVRTHSFRES